MSVTAEMLKPFLEGWTMKQIIEAKRLYYVDLKIVEDLPTKDDNEVSICDVIIAMTCFWSMFLLW